MTRNSDLDCADLIGCRHEAEVPVTDGDTILYWLCACGRRVKEPEPDKQSEP